MSFSDNYWDLIIKEAKWKGGEFFFYAEEGREMTLRDMECEDISGWLIPFSLTEEFRDELNEKDADEIDPKWLKYFKKAVWDNSSGYSVTIKFEDFRDDNNDYHVYKVDNSNDEEVFENQYIVLEQRIPGLVRGELFYDENNNKIQEFILGDKHLWLFNNYERRLIYMESEFDLDPYFPLPELSLDEEDK
jgi:hypothetical protein